MPIRCTFSRCFARRILAKSKGQLESLSNVRQAHLLKMHLLKMLCEARSSEVKWSAHEFLCYVRVCRKSARCTFSRYFTRRILAATFGPLSALRKSVFFDLLWSDKCDSAILIKKSGSK